MPQRFPCDRSHLNFSLGDIGKLQTLAQYPIVAGESGSLDLEGVWRLSPLRRNLVVDCQVELFAFFVPHRHVYGAVWTDFIKDGPFETETFTTAPTSLLAISFLGSRILISENYPLWRIAGYNQIWNRYFRSPSDALKRADTYLPTASNEFISGYGCGYLPTPWSTTHTGGVADTTRDVTTVGDVFDIADLNVVQAQFKTEVDKEYFGERYNDLLNVRFGSRVNTDADQRPTLVAHNRWWLSGYDVDATDDAAIGTYAGKSAGTGGLSFRRKFFPEHGCLHILCLLRFPTIHEKERPYLHFRPNPTWLEIAGDPATLAAQKPQTLNAVNWFEGGSGNLGFTPYGQWYRYYPASVHPGYAGVQGYTFLNKAITDGPSANYIQDTEYDEVFQTLQLRHWNSSVRIGYTSMSPVPPARHSLYSGA